MRLTKDELVQTSEAAKELDRDIQVQYVNEVLKIHASQGVTKCCIYVRRNIWYELLRFYEELGFCVGLKDPIKDSDDFVLIDFDWGDE